MQVFNYDNAKISFQYIAKIDNIMNVKRNITEKETKKSTGLVGTFQYLIKKTNATKVHVCERCEKKPDHHDPARRYAPL